MPELDKAETSSVATLQTIADKLDISVATVSRALNGIQGISRNTRERVMKTAAEVGYSIASPLRAGSARSERLLHAGILMPLRAGIPAPLYLVGLSATAAEFNVSLSTHCVRSEDCAQLLNPAFQPAALKSGVLAGLILIFRWPHEIVRELGKMLPLVSIIHRYEGLADFVGIDDKIGVDMLFNHLRKLGHAKIGFLGRCADLHWAASRFAAYVSALTANSFEYRPGWAIGIPQEELTDLRLPLDPYVGEVEKLIKQDGVRAWMCSSEGVAVQLHEGLTARGLRVPQDVSITGFHKAMRHDPAGPDLTSVSVSYEAMGGAALRRLLRRIQNPEEPAQNILFEPEFYLGSSTAAPGASTLEQHADPSN